MFFIQIQSNRDQLYSNNFNNFKLFSPASSSISGSPKCSAYAFDSILIVSCLRKVYPWQKKERQTLPIKGEAISGMELN